LWPTALVILLARFDRISAAKVAGAVILAAPALRLLMHFCGNDFLAHRIYFMLHTRLDSLMFGCLVALLEGTAVLESTYRRLRPLWALFPIYVFLISPQLEHRFGGAYTYAVGYTLIGFSIAMMVIYVVRENRTLVGDLLNSRVFVHIGVISYSIYIWQELFLHENNTSCFGKFPLNLLCLAVLAEFSHRCVEQPFMACRKWFERPQASTALSNGCIGVSASPSA